VDHLRAGRFVHVVSSGARQSFALSRVTEELVQKIEADEWVTLDAITEYGFRYLVPPDEVAGRVEGGAAVQLQPMKESSIGDALGGVTSLLKAPRPKSVASASETGTPTAARREAEPEPASETPETPAAPQAAAADPAPQVPVSPSIADAALEGLDTDALRAHLREEMAKVDTLQTRVTALQKALDESQAREKDLLDVLAKWQSRA